MSIKIRRAIMYWFTLFLGIFILCYQFFNYINGSLALTLPELAVTVLAVVFMINPHSIRNAFHAGIKSKFGDKADDK